MSIDGRIADEDQFYIPVKTRKGKKSWQKVQQQGDVADARRTGKSEGSTKTEISTAQNLNVVDQSSISPTNLDRFLGSTTPSVRALYFSKTTMRSWRTCDVEYQYYFTLDALWESFMEWSAYGAGVPLVLDGSYSNVVQYYVPYLSAIQLYGRGSMSDANLRQVGEDSDGDDSRVSGSDGSSDYEVEEGLNFSSLQQTCQLMMSKVSCTERSFSSLEKNNQSEEGFSSDDSEAGNARGRLLFEFLEPQSPYYREPFAEKIEELAKLFPGLKTLRSCDLLPLSWFSVAWYPIYRIPTGPTLKDLDACFLTFHHLSVPSKGTRGSQSPMLVFPNVMDEIPRFVLNAFGLAVYRFKGALWSQNEVGGESSRVKSLIWAADEWVKLVGVTHPDFDFFISRG